MPTPQKTRRIFFSPEIPATPLGLISLATPKLIEDHYRHYTIRYEDTGRIHGGISFLHQQQYEEMVRTYRIDLQLQTLEAFNEALALIVELGEKEHHIFFPCWVASRNASSEGSRHFYPALTISFFLPELRAHQLYPSNAHTLDWLTKLSHFLHMRKIPIKRPDANFYFIVPKTNNALGFRVGYEEGKDLSFKEALDIAQKQDHPTYNPFGIKKLILDFPNGLLKKSALTYKMLRIHDFIDQQVHHSASDRSRSLLRSPVFSHESHSISIRTDDSSDSFTIQSHGLT